MVSDEQSYYIEFNTIAVRDQSAQDFTGRMNTALDVVGARSVTSLYGVPWVRSERIGSSISKKAIFESDQLPGDILKNLKVSFPEARSVTMRQSEVDAPVEFILSYDSSRAPWEENVYQTSSAPASAAASLSQDYN